MIYLDHNATTPIDSDALEWMNQVAREAFGNPGSRHPAGRRARQVLEDSRELMAEILHAEADEVVFTSGGTESSNLAIRGLTAGRTGAIVVPPAEHPATEETVKELVFAGCQKYVLPLDGQGRLQEPIPDDVLEGAILGTALLAHNETGVLQELKPLIERFRQRGIPFHVDAVQSVGKVPVDFHDLGATTLSFGAHKFYGPRGIGGLLVKRGTRLTAALHGGHQERGIRPGTEPVMLIAGMARALKNWHDQQQALTERLMTLRDRLQAGLTEQCSPVVVNGHPVHRLPNTLHIAFPGCDADALLVALDMADVCCSLGSACASGSSEPAPILVAMQLPAEVYTSSLRLSVGHGTTAAEIDEAVTRISQVVRHLRNVAGSQTASIRTDAARG